MSELEKGHHPAQKRLILEELLAHHLSMLAIRAGNERLYAEPLVTSGQLKSQLLAQLPFSPTNAQNRVVGEIEADLAKDAPMMRLIQGDVGSGKLSLQP